MFLPERIQLLIHDLDEGYISRWLRYLMLAAIVGAIAVIYDLRAYRNFSTQEAMDGAQVARNLANGHGFSTDYIRPFSLYLVQRHNRMNPAGMGTNTTDLAEVYTHHPDLANAPVYPLALAGLMKIWPPVVKVETKKPFWTEGGYFRRYKPEFVIAVFNQILFVGVVMLTFFIARKILDSTAAWLAAALTVGSGLLWRFSVSGLSTMLLLVFFMGLVLCLLKVEELARETTPNARKLFLLAAVAGLIMGLGMLTRYSFGWVIGPVVAFLVLFGGPRRHGLAVVASLIFVLVVSPWIARNVAVSGTPLGTAGYALLENTDAYPGAVLMQSVSPDLAINWVFPVVKKMALNVGEITQNSLTQLGSSWISILFFAGLLLSLRNDAARRLRYFLLLCLAVFVVIQSAGATQLSTSSPEVNSENLLVIFTPLVIIFGVAFFLTLLEQMQLPIIQMRHAAMILLGVIIWLPLALPLAVAATSPVVYPPYHPPEIQRFSNWMDKDELMMSDIPWAIAWYGDRQCVWLTRNTTSDFSEINDFIKPVNGLFLTLNTLDARLFTDCIKGEKGSWPSFVYQTVVAKDIPSNFPLRQSPYGLSSGLFLTDKQRWKTQ
ncbi:MAG TPA: glycosyltransferase family 39 protein [Verrucomicrobiae bacterium]|jgi:4-amino-4-deoxy-L-arabinose transferase-like glycosyltransferase